MAQARAAIDRVLAGSPNTSLLTRDEFKGDVANQINKVLNLVYVLLAMALVIALFGIANTLALSVYERTREFGLLRAVGMARSQVRATVRWESVLIALLGTALGTALGLGFSWAMIRAASGTELAQLSVPVGELVAIVAVAAGAAVVAAALPARRAARLDVLARDQRRLSDGAATPRGPARMRRASCARAARHRRHRERDPHTEAQRSTSSS